MKVVYQADVKNATLNFDEKAVSSDTGSLTSKEVTESSDFVMTPKEVAHFTKFSEKKIYRLCKSNEIPFKRVGGQYRFVRTDIERWLKGE